MVVPETARWQGAPSDRQTVPGDSCEDREEFEDPVFPSRTVEATERLVVPRSDFFNLVHLRLSCNIFPGTAAMTPATAFEHLEALPTLV